MSESTSSETHTEADITSGPADGPALVTGPAPVLELTYAFYRLMRPRTSKQGSGLPWLRQLEEGRPDWLEAARAVFGEEQRYWLGYEALLLGCALGYGFDEDPSRFLADLRDLPTKMSSALETLGDGTSTKPPLAGSRAARIRARLSDNYQQLATPAAMSNLRVSLEALWQHLEMAWLNDGLEVSAAASRRLKLEAARSGDVLSALPAHHFVRFESSADDIRHSQAQGRIAVAPLYFAAMGGFKFTIGGVVYLGYSVRSEKVFEERKAQVTQLAGRAKALADPTRLLLLMLIGRLTRFPLTVGDLARQLGVSQPTASGHLRLLRELELVEMVKRGNRSYYRLRHDSVKLMLAELEELLTAAPSSEEGL